MKIKFKNFFLCNISRLFLSTCLLGIYIYFFIQEIHQYRTYFSLSQLYAPVAYIVTNIVLFAVMLLPIIFVICKIIRNRNAVPETYGIAMNIFGRIFLDSFFVIIYFIVFLTIRLFTFTNFAVFLR